MTIYAHSTSSYETLPRWRCTVCGLEHDSRDKGGFNVLSVYSSRKRFVQVHARAKPHCDGKFEYVEGVKRVH